MSHELWNGKGSIDLTAVGPESLENVARLCAWSLAHARARAYADQNEADYQAFIERACL